jgi:hypothetical protein
MGGDTYRAVFDHDQGVTVSVEIDALESVVPQLEALRG